MTVQTTLSAKHFRDDLLIVLGQLTGWKTSQAVEHDKVYEPVCKRMGIPDVYAHGVNDASGQPMVVKWIQWAHKAAMQQGFTTSPQRGRWALTPLGVAEAGRLMSGSDDLVVPATPATETMKEPAMEAQVVELHPHQEDGYHPDPYIRSLAAKSTPCFGHYSDKSSVCGRCPIQGPCQNFMASDLSRVARLLAEEVTSEVMDVALDEALSGGTPHPRNPSGPVPIITSSRRVTRIENVKEAVCEHCRQTIPRGVYIYWVRPGTTDKVKGVFHESCLKVGDQ